MNRHSVRVAGSACALVAAVLMSQARSVAAPVEAALGPQVAIGEPSNGYVGRLEVSPRHGPAGTPVTLAAEGLPPGQEFQLV